MNEKMADWADLQLFLAVAREGGLSAAARATGRSPATMGRRMLALERALDAELFLRHDRGYELTAEARKLLTELTEVESRLHRITEPRNDARRPLIKISAGTWTTLHLLGNFDRIAGRPADLRLRFVSAEDVLDIAHREIVIGFRNSRPTNPALAGRKLQQVQFAPYATATAPDRWIKVLADVPSARWLDRKIGADAVCEVTAPRNSLDLALAGQGIALLPTFIGDRQAALRRLGAPVSELTHDQWIVTHQDDRHLPAVRRGFDRLVQAL